MKILHIVRRLPPVASFLMGLTLLSLGMLLVALHARAVRDMSEIGLPAALALPQIEKRAEILAEQNEIAQLQTALRSGSTEEMVRVYIIPEKEEIDRLLAVFDVLFGYLEQKKMLTSFSAVEVGEATEGVEGMKSIPVSFDAIVTHEGMADLLLFSELSGLLTVSDALTQKDIDAMLAVTEQENPASVAALEHFLSTDLLRYSEEPRPYEEQLRKSFSPAAENALRLMFDTPRLRRARMLYSEMAPVLRQQNLWPLRLLTVEKASAVQEGGMVRLSMTLNAYVRGE